MSDWNHAHDWYGMNGGPIPPADAVVLYADGSFSAIMFHYAGESASAKTIAAENGFDLKVVEMQEVIGDDDALYRAYFEEGSSNVVRQWQPPTIDGWRLVGKTDSEDGPAAFYVRPHQQPPEGSIAPVALSEGGE